MFQSETEFSCKKMTPEKRICHRCNIEKIETDFYKYTSRSSVKTNGNYKQICKHCENHNNSKYELYTCNICSIVIRKKNKIKHENSYRHTKNYFWNQSYDSSRLQLQNKRST